MKRHELWRQEYRKKRYLEHLEEESLWRRGQDILLNLVTVTGAGKLGVVGLGAIRESLMVAWTEFLEECALRRLPYPPPASFVRGARIPDVASELCQKASQAVAQMSGLPEKILVKYSKKEFLRETHATGLIRVMPATSFNDPTLNPARRDNELMKVFCEAPIDVELRNAGAGETRRVKVMSTFGNVVEGDYYVYCMSRLLVPRLFYDFDADACLIVRDPDRFFAAMAIAAEAALPGWRYGHGEVKYIDPLAGEPEFHWPPTVEQLFFSKHFRFCYQREVRLLWMPIQPATGLQPVFLHVADLESYCSLLEV